MSVPLYVGISNKLSHAWAIYRSSPRPRVAKQYDKTRNRQSIVQVVVVVVVVGARYPVARSSADDNNGNLNAIISLARLSRALKSIIIARE